MREKLRKFYINNKPIIRFYLLLGYFILILFLLLHNRYSYKYLAHYFPAFLAEVTAKIIKMFGGKVSVVGEAINGSRFSMRIIYDCSGIFIIAIYIAAVLAYPASLKKIGLGLLIGIPILSLINILRMVFMFYIGQFSPNYVNLFHIYFWQGIFIILVLLLWLLWVEKVVHNEK